ncbi:unnamed protein product [Tilletia controversa]|uniref:Uncharacterized protein n=1 Tax=Tilletia caries TaxID=13290 RepID=A0A177T4U4_9BASI|nr:hypothetical protein CF335_g5448 [Tilletia laevis]KAE8249209.1 hypothetical protein A4X03_0g6648 [Tilletia caries]CAD6915989.1 unnamed protein product [Tilletia controversa]CAD6924849.1 unnamed protein product [Tilletia caries]CAD6961957.1 unnamed protein product [Tilletia controversa]
MSTTVCSFSLEAATPTTSISTSDTHPSLRSSTSLRSPSRPAFKFQHIPLAKEEDMRTGLRCLGTRFEEVLKVELERGSSSALLSGGSNSQVQRHPSSNAELHGFQPPAAPARVRTGVINAGLVPIFAPSNVIIEVKSVPGDHIDSNVNASHIQDMRLLCLQEVSTTDLDDTAIPR